MRTQRVEAKDVTLACARRMKAVAVHEEHPLSRCVAAVLKAPIDVKVSQQTGHVTNRLLGVVPITFGMDVLLMACIQNDTATSSDRENLRIPLEEAGQFIELCARLYEPCSKVIVLRMRRAVAARIRIGEDEEDQGSVDCDSSADFHFVGLTGLRFSGFVPRAARVI